MRETPALKDRLNMEGQTEESIDKWAEIRTKVSWFLVLDPIPVDHIASLIVTMLFFRFVWGGERGGGRGREKKAAPTIFEVLLSPSPPNILSKYNILAKKSS